MAQARREIVHALHLHRSSSSRTSTSTSTSSSSSSSSSATILESMPIPGPIWSTTQPSIPVAAPVVVPVAATMEGFEFEWGSSENQASSYTWWLGFLKALDSKNNNNNNNIVDQNYSKYPCLERIHHLMGGGHNLCDVDHQAPDSVDATHDDQQNSSPDQWLMFPTNDDDHQNY
ncbi:hypothetical protein Dsin_007291 [Dipteronia sinensis]|uniref:Uncharacterized protein n=1 Tax=Dipteronia sinensis TaxID=43782 RepID=A0AAE0B1A0_9ROSI|nr:hypothetical protein Dsin_007291 [Dipteronia sinensis]